MKNYFFLFVCVLAQSLSAQENTDPKAADQTIYTTATVDVKPEFPGGVDKMYAFVAHHFKMPEKNITGKIFILFIVEKDGTITNIKATRDVGSETGKEAIRVVKLFPQWLPGEKDGYKVRTQYQFPIQIN